ncbi:MAG: hypothetical protein HYZ75_10085 [Elusimicrobia bacterium]|nr:hypothetical protein [Elusimicrobiota bacterium]
MTIFLAFLLSVAPLHASFKSVLPAPALPAATLSSPVPVFAPRLAVPTAAAVLPTLTLTPALAPAAPVVIKAAVAAAAVPAAQAAPLPATAEAARPALSGKSSWVNLFDGRARSAVNGVVAGSAFVSERASYETARSIQGFYHELATIHALERGALVSEALETRKRTLWTSLRAVDARLSGPAAEPFAAVSARLKAQRAARAALPAVAPEALAADQALLATQVRAALLMLEGGSRLASKDARRNAALWTLNGAWGTAASLRAETRWLESRRQIPAAFSAAPVAIPQTRWHNAATGLDDAGRDARNGRPAEAAAKLAGLERLFTVSPEVLEPGFTAPTGQVKAGIVQARQALAGGDAAALAAALDAAKGMIAYPKMSSVEVVEYADTAAAGRAQRHKLESMAAESERVSQRAAETDYWAELAGAAGLKGPERRPLVGLEVTAFRSFLADAAAWAGRGFVRSRQEAAERLAAAAEAAEAGRFDLAAARLRSAKSTLDKRVKDLRDMRAAIERRAKSLNGRHETLLEAAARWKRALAKPLDETRARDLAGDVRSHREAYLAAVEPGLPGYARAAEDLARLETALAALKRDEAKALVARFQEDLIHRRSLRVSVVLRPRKSGGIKRASDRFVLPGTTLGTLLKRVGGKPEKPEVRLDRGEWTPWSELDLRGKLADRTLVEILL